MLRKKPPYALLLMLIISLFVNVQAFSQTYDTPVNASEGATYVKYSGTVDMTADGDSIASHYSQALYIGDSNQSVALIQFSVPDVTGTEDLNVFAEFSQNRKDWSSVSAAIHDQLTAGVTYDTLHIINTTSIIELQGSVYLRIHVDGQTGNPSNTITWDAYLKKNQGAPARTVATVLNRRT